MLKKKSLIGSFKDKAIFHVILEIDHHKLTKVKEAAKKYLFSGHFEVQFQRDFSGCFLDRNRIQFFEIRARIQTKQPKNPDPNKKKPDPDPNKISGPGSVTLDTAPRGKIYMFDMLIADLSDCLYFYTFFPLYLSFLFDT